MKKALIIVILIIASQYAKAQDKKLELGIEGGPNSSDIYSSSSLMNVGPAYHFSIGLTGQYNISETFSIKTGIGYEKKGYTLAFSYVTNPASPDPFYTTYNPFNMDYMVIPIEARMTFGKKIKFFVDAGPYLGFMTGAKTTITALDSIGHKYSFSENDMINRYKHFDFGAGAGIGLERAISERWIIDLEVRLNYGFLNNGYPFSNSPSVENESSNILLGLRYKI